MLYYIEHTLGSIRYIDNEGVAHTGVTAARRLTLNRNKWKGDLTAEKIAEVVRYRKELAHKYPEEIPNAEYGKTIQSYNNVTDFAINVLTPDAEYNEFAEEFRNRSDEVYFSTKYGRTKATKNKIAAGMLMTTIVYWAGIGTLSLLSFGVMGISGFHTPYQIDQPYSIYPMTYGQYYLLILVCGYISGLLSASLTMLVTAKMHSANVAICIPFLIFYMTPFIGRMLPSFNTFFYLTPYVLMNLIQYTRAAIIFQVGNIVFRQILCFGKYHF